MEDNHQSGNTKHPDDHDHDHDHDQDRDRDQPQRIPFTRLRQVDSDFVLAVALQNQERAFSLETIDSEAESEASYDEQQDLVSFGFESGELGFMEEDYSEDEEMDDDDDDDDELDVDELTYEELIALGEFIGVEERGLSEKEISSCLRPIVCKTTSSSVDDDRCVVCQVEYEDGEQLVALRCEHSYHSDCITKWLQIKKCCPICSSEVSSSSSSSIDHSKNKIN